LLKNLFKHNRLLFNQLSNISDINNDFYSVIWGVIQAKNYLYEDNLNLNNEIENILSLNDISPISFGV